jgi:hypothetical protein
MQSTNAILASLSPGTARHCGLIFEQFILRARPCCSRSATRLNPYTLPAGRDGVRYARSKHIGDIDDASAIYGSSRAHLRQRY